MWNPPPTTNFTPPLPWIREKNYSENKEQTAQSTWKKEGKCWNIFKLKCKPHVHTQGRFCAEFLLVDNLVASDRHEIGCESLESHFHKDCRSSSSQTRGWFLPALLLSQFMSFHEQFLPPNHHHHHSITIIAIIVLAQCDVKCSLMKSHCVTNNFPQRKADFGDSPKTSTALVGLLIFSDHYFNTSYQEYYLIWNIKIFSELKIFSDGPTNGWTNH